MSISTNLEPYTEISIPAKVAQKKKAHARILLWQSLQLFVEEDRIEAESG